MKENLKIRDAISPRTDYKRRFSLLEMYRAFVLLPGAMMKMIANKRSNLVDQGFVERLQLAVTGVNGCTVCSYAHSYMALKQGMSKEEICSFLIGEDSFIRPDEAKAIMFAQHYADTRGFPKKDAFDSITSEYGEKRAGIILSAILLITSGNIYGIPYSAFQSRLKGQAYKTSSIFYELGMMLAGILILPFVIVHGVLGAIFGISNIRLDKSSIDK